MIYPDTLPRPDQVNYSGVIDNGLSRSGIPSALAYQTQLFNSKTTVITLQFSMSNSTWVEWNSWVQEYGWDWFEFPYVVSGMIPNDITSSHRVRIIGEVGYQKRGHNWLTTTVQVELVPGDSQDPAAGGGLWTPSSLDNALMWFDAADAATVTEALGGRVTNWADKSGNGHDVEQTTTPTQPVTGVETLNELNVLRFDGAQTLQVPDEFPIPTQAAIFYVFYADDASDRQDVFTKSSPTGNGTSDFEWRSGVRVVNSASDGRIEFQPYGSGGPVTMTSSASMADGVAQVIGFNYVDGNFDIRMSGSEVAASASNVSLGVGRSTGNRIFVGSTENNNRWLTGAIAEILVLSGDVELIERQRVEGYLAWRWGLSAALPGDHPYSSGPPVLDSETDFIIAGTPATPSPDWIIAGTPAAPSEDWIRAELYYVGE